MASWVVENGLRKAQSVRGRMREGSNTEDN